jgi:hypothetical protein
MSTRTHTRTKTGGACKLSKDERLVDEQMLAMLEWVSAKRRARLPSCWGRRGVIEIWPETGLYRLKQPSRE